MIAKQADGITEFFWKKDAGPVENILGLVEYGYMFLGGWMGRVAMIIAQLLGLSLKNVGKYIDQKFNLRTLDDLAGMSETAHIEAMNLKPELVRQSNLKYHKLYAMYEDLPWESMSSYQLEALGFKNFDYRTVNEKSALEILMGLGNVQKGFGTSRMGNLLGALKTVAQKILTGGLLSFLTLKGIQAAKEGSNNKVDHVHGKDITEQINHSKDNLESEIRKALSTM